MMNKKNFLLLFISIFLSLPLFSQMTEQPIEWQSKLVPLQGNTFEVQVIGVISNTAWHIYDLGPYTDGPNATTLNVEVAKNAKLVGKPYLKTKVKKKFDEMFGMDIGICEERVVIAQKIELLNIKASEVKVTVEWQACDDGSCLPPTEKEFKIALPAANPSLLTAVDQKKNNELVAVPTSTSDQGPKQDSIQENSSGSTNLVQAPSVVTPSTPQKGVSIWGVIIEAIIWGFVALLTPCVFPMVPMTVSFFLKSSQSASGSKSRGKMMASFYGLSIVALYTIPIAIIIGITYFAGGDAVTADIFNWLATHWIPNVLFFLIFMVFAASFFGAFEITLPSWMVNKSDEKSDKGGYVGVFFMALTLVLVSFSCTGPIVGTVLIKSTQGEIWQPIVTMFAFSAAFALPFTIFAFAPSLLKDLPKSGGWLNSVKVVLGFIEVALGFKFLSVADQTYHWGILDREVYLAIWIVVFALLGLYLLGKLRFAHDDPSEHITVKRLTLSIITFTFVVYMIPGMWGAPLKALSGYMPPLTTQDFVLGKNVQNTEIQSQGGLGFKPKYSDFLHLPHGLEGFFEYNEAIAYAKKIGKPLFVDFTGHGCVNCREMESRVWSDQRVLKLLNDKFVILALYVDDKKEAEAEDWITTENGNVIKSIGKINYHLAVTKYKVNAQPYYAIIDPNTELHLTQPRGYNLDVEAFIKFLESGEKK